MVLNRDWVEELWDPSGQIQDIESVLTPALWHLTTLNMSLDRYAAQLGTPSEVRGEYLLGSWRSRDRGRFGDLSLPEAISPTPNPVGRDVDWMEVDQSETSSLDRRRHACGELRTLISSARELLAPARRKAHVLGRAVSRQHIASEADALDISIYIQRIRDASAATATAYDGVRQNVDTNLAEKEWMALIGRAEQQLYGECEAYVVLCDGLNPRVTEALPPYGEDAMIELNRLFTKLRESTSRACYAISDLPWTRAAYRQALRATGNRGESQVADTLLREGKLDTCPDLSELAYKAKHAKEFVSRESNRLSESVRILLSGDPHVIDSLRKSLTGFVDVLGQTADSARRHSHGKKGRQLSSTQFHMILTAHRDKTLDVLTQVVDSWTKLTLSSATSLRTGFYDSQLEMYRTVEVSPAKMAEQEISALQEIVDRLRSFPGDLHDAQLAEQMYRLHEWQANQVASATSAT
jgi:hypothetical protein